MAVATLIAVRSHSGTRMFTLQIDNGISILQGKMRGRHTTYRQAKLLPTPPQLFHCRTGAGSEVDVVMELDGLLYPVEVKCKTQLSGHDTSGLRTFRQTYGQSRIGTGLIVYAGRECYRIDRDTIALPWHLDTGG